MGIEYSAVIIVGLRREDIENVERLCDKYGEFIGGLEDCSSYYDGGGEDQNVIGFTVAQSPDYGNDEIHFEELAVAIQSAKELFKEATNQDAKIYLSTYGW